jgi:flagellar basal-body rod protein FlgF
MAFTSTATGPMRPTGDPLDLAINGNAYFAVQTPEGERYTRDGSFTLDSNGRIVTRSTANR